MKRRIAAMVIRLAHRAMRWAHMDGAEMPKEFADLAELEAIAERAAARANKETPSRRGRRL